MLSIGRYEILTVITSIHDSDFIAFITYFLHEVFVFYKRLLFYDMKLMLIVLFKFQVIDGHI